MWLRDHRQVTKFGVNELFTCFQMVHWKLPNDPGQALRNAAKADYQYLRAEGTGSTGHDGRNEQARGDRLMERLKELVAGVNRFDELSRC